MNDKKIKVWNEAEVTQMMRLDDVTPVPYDVEKDKPFYRIETPDGNNVHLTIEALIAIGDKARDFRAKYGIALKKHQN